MANLSGISKLGVPHLSGNLSEEDEHNLRNYLYQFQEQMQYILSNLDGENFAEELNANLDSMNSRLSALEKL